MTTPSELSGRDQRLEAMYSDLRTLFPTKRQWALEYLKRRVIKPKETYLEKVIASGYELGEMMHMMHLEQDIFCLWFVRDMRQADYRHALKEGIPTAELKMNSAEQVTQRLLDVIEHDFGQQYDGESLTGVRSWIGTLRETSRDVCGMLTAGHFLSAQLEEYLDTAADRLFTTRLALGVETDEIMDYRIELVFQK